MPTHFPSVFDRGVIGDGAKILRPLIISGGPAVGKTICGRALAVERERAAFVDADDIRQLVVAGDETLWSGVEGESQLILAAKNIAAMGRNFVRVGFELTIADFVTADSLTVYRAELPDCFVVHLRISLDGARERAGTRKVYLTDGEFELLHEMIATPPAVDLVIDVEGLTQKEQLAVIRNAWSNASDKSR